MYVVFATAAAAAPTSVDTLCSLKQAEPAQRARFPHFGPKFRYSGRTQHETRGSDEDTARQRTIPKINRKASTRFIGAKEQGYNVGSKCCCCYRQTDHTKAQCVAVGGIVCVAARIFSWNGGRAQLSHHRFFHRIFFDSDWSYLTWWMIPQENLQLYS